MRHLRIAAALIGALLLLIVLGGAVGARHAPVPPPATATATPLLPTGTGTAPTAIPTPTCGVARTPGPWAEVRPYPLALSGVAVASDGSALYAFGGSSGGNPHNEAYKYDPSADTWTALAPVVPAEDFDMEAAYGGNGKIYVLGGYNQQNATRVYDIATNSWTMGAPLPWGVFNFGHAYADGRIYVIGGVCCNNAPSSRVYAYDIPGNSWRMLAPLPQPESGMASAAINGKIYVANGTTGIDRLNNLYIYDIASNTWTAGPASPQASYAPAGTIISGKLYVIGGTDAWHAIASTYLYDPAANAWAAGPNLNVARQLANAATVATAGGETAIAVGGLDATLQAPLNSVETSTAPGVPCPGATPTVTATPRPTDTPCPINFADVQPADYFYTPVQYLYCHAVISGYSTSPPCAPGTSCFQPYATTTRAQMVKIVVLGFNRPLVTPTAGAYTFADVPPAQPFYPYVETAAALHVVSGYNCGGSGEPCDAQNRPYFRPGNPVSRGQLAKIDVLAAGWLPEQLGWGTFHDVPVGSTFYPYVEAAACRGIISGYNCGSTSEPCDLQNRPYFRPDATSTRGQISKFVYLSINNTQGCVPPSPPTGGYHVSLPAQIEACQTTVSATITYNGAPVAGVQMQAHWTLFDYYGQHTYEDCSAVSGPDGVTTCGVPGIPNMAGGRVDLVFTTPDHVTIVAGVNVSCGGLK